MMKCRYGQASAKNAVLEKNGGGDGWLNRTIKIFTSREAEETSFFCHEAAEALAAGFPCIFYVFFYEPGGRIHKDGSSISEVTLKRRESVYKTKILPSKYCFILLYI